MNTHEPTTDITRSFGELYFPKWALVVYQNDTHSPDTYIESFDMDENGNLINAHPLTVQEGQALAKALNTEKEQEKTFLKPNGIIPTNVLYIDPNENGSVVWFTKSRKRPLFFIERLGIPNGVAYVPPMLWKASRNRLSVYALATDRRPTESTALYYAPFFNVYDDNSVCMGTVDVKINPSASLEEFIHEWEESFFNSYFSHLINGHNPVKGNIVTLWKKLIGTDKPFPKEVLIKNRQTLKKLLK
jgi:PRTRC genetic system protein B